MGTFLYILGMGKFFLILTQNLGTIKNVKIFDYIKICLAKCTGSKHTDNKLGIVFTTSDRDKG